MEEMIRGVLRDVYPWPSVATGRGFGEVWRSFYTDNQRHVRETSIFRTRPGVR